MDRLLLHQDTILCAIDCVKHLCNATPAKMSAYEVIFNVTNIVCTIINVLLVYYIYKRGEIRDDEKTVRQRNMNMFQALVLNYSINSFYKFYSDLISVTNELLESGITTEQKQKINDKIISNLGPRFRVEFVDCLNAIDLSLYENIMIQYDTLVDGITNNIFDEGINLSHKPKFDEIITTRIFQAKTEMLGLLFRYNG